MKKLIVMICILAMCFCGCSKANDTNEVSTPPKQVIVFPTEQVAETLNGYRDSVASNIQNSIEYVGNSKTKKFHLPDCMYVKNIKSENTVRFSNRSNIINKGYSPCQTCNP